MPIINRKPRNSSLRFQTYIDNSDITSKKPESSLVFGLRKKAGRNSYGRITVRHHGGGVKRKYRFIDFDRMHKNVEGEVKTIEYDPNRNVRIGLVVYANGAKVYNLIPKDLKVGSKIYAAIDADPKIGNSLILRNVPVGFIVHNIELKPNSGGKIARSAGSYAQIIAKTENYATLKMPSGEIRMVHLDCWATIGELSNADHKNISIGKAGRTRRMGIRPTVRGMAMNPIDHPHGGGEGRSKSGSHPVSPWGKGAKGTRTRKRKNPLILKRRRP